MRRRPYQVGLVLGALVLGGCEAGTPSEPGGPTPAPTSTATGNDLTPRPGMGSSSGATWGGFAPGSGPSAGPGSGAVSGSTWGASLGVASSRDDLTAGRFATSFDVLSTEDLLVVAKVGASFDGQKLGLNFQSPSGGTLAGYTAIVADGKALFDVKLGGTSVGRTAQTGVFPITLGEIGSQRELARTTITLTQVRTVPQ